MEKQRFVTGVQNVIQRDIKFLEKEQKLKKYFIIAGEEFGELEKKISKWKCKLNECKNANAVLAQAVKELKEADEDLDAQRQLLKATITDSKAKIQVLRRTNTPYDSGMERLKFCVVKALLGVYIEPDPNDHDTYRGFVVNENDMEIVPFEFSEKDLQEPKSKCDTMFSVLPSDITNNFTLDWKQYLQND